MERFTTSLKPCAALGLAFLMTLATPARAHPHAWIDVRSTVVIAPTGMVSAIEQQWLFDELYSAAVLEQMTLEHPDNPRAVADFAPRVMENLAPYGYFMRVFADKRPLKLQTVTQFKSEKIVDESGNNPVDKPDGAQLLLSFTAQFAEPVDPLEKTLTFSVFDPTYFIRMSHVADESSPMQNAAFNGVDVKGNPRCRAEIHPAKPTPEMFARALALDIAAAPQEDLGELFAETVQVQCQ